MARQTEPMKPECRKIISGILGRDFSEDESRKWLADMRREFRFVAGTEEAVSGGWSKETIAREAAKRLANHYMSEAARRRENAKRQVIATAEIINRRQKYIKAGSKAYHASANVLREIDQRITGTRKQYIGQFIEAVRAIDTRFFGLIEDRKTALAFVQELFGEDSGNATAKKAAEAWKKAAGGMRERFNLAGGDIGDLGDDWRMPQSHDLFRLLKADKLIQKNYKNKYKSQDNRSAWVDFLFDRIDKSRYVDDEGRALNDADIKEVLGQMYDNITEGKASTGASVVAGTKQGRFADRHSKHRAIYFKDGQSFFEYHSMFARNPSIVGTLIAHANSMARDTVLLEEMGPSPNSSFALMDRLASEEARQHMAEATGPVKTWGYKNACGSLGASIQDIWATMNGEAGTVLPSHAGIAAGGQFLRDMQIWGKLGQAFITSVTDLPNYFVATGYAGLSWNTSIRNVLTTWGKADQEFAARAGIIADSISDDMCRWTQENLGYRWSGKLAGATMQLSLLSGWTDGIRRAFALNMIGAIGKLSRKADWNKLDAWDKFQLEKYGVTEADWKLFQLAQTEKYRGCDMLTRSSVEEIPDAELAKIGATRNDARKAASKLMSILTNEAQVASLQPDVFTRAGVSRGRKKGDVGGELLKSFMLFKSFPFGMVNTHLMRMEDKGRFLRDQGSGKFQVMASQSGYLASLIIGTTLMGYISNQAKCLIAGKDLEDYTAPDTWLSAFTVGGGAGILGDLLVNAMDDTKFGHPNVINFFGPVVGTFLSASDAWDAVKSGKDAGAKTARLVRSNLPFINIWYVKAMLDHTVLNQMNEALSPGYTRRMERNLRKRTGQEFWRTSDGIRRMPRRAHSPSKWWWED